MNKRFGLANATEKDDTINPSYWLSACGKEGCLKDLFLVTLLHDLLLRDVLAEEGSFVKFSLTTDYDFHQLWQCEIRLTVTTRVRSSYANSHLVDFRVAVTIILLT